MNILITISRVAIVLFGAEFFLEVGFEHLHLFGGNAMIKSILHSVSLIAICTPIIYFLAIEPYISEREVAFQKLATSRAEANVARAEGSREVEETLFNIINESPVAIGITDETGTPVFWNDAFRKFGWRKDQGTQKGEFQLMFADPNLRTNLFNKLKSGSHVRGAEAEVITASEEPAWVAISIQEMVFEGQKSYLTWVYDITEQKLREKIQDDAKRGAEEASKAKSDFLATMSHEIRTPLNGVMTMAEMMGGTNLTVEQQGMVEIIHDSSASLVSIINDVLDFSKIESDKLELDSVSMSITQIVEGVSDLLGAQAAEKGVCFYTVVDSEAHNHFEGDPVRLRQILTNLAGNALKFTDKGDVSIRVTANGQATDQQSLTFRVCDTGIGIEKDKLNKLFMPFTQADTSTARRFGGSGLGLSISKALVEAMGGEIGVSSEPGAGSTFWFNVSLKACPEKRASRKGKVSGMGVVVVSENQGFSNMIEGYMNFVGAAVKTATDVHRMLAVLEEYEASDQFVDMVLLDADMPSREAEDAITSVFAEESRKDVKVILLVNRKRMLAQRPEYWSQVSGELPTPLHRNELWDVASAVFGKELVDKNILYGKRAEDERVVVFVPPDVETARAEGRLVLVAEDNSVNQKVIKMLLDKMGIACEVVDDGQAALNALQQREYAMLLTDCHMPEMDGYTLTEHLRRQEKDNHSEKLPVVALTADALIGTREKCRQSGMDAYLKKPIGRQELEDVLYKYLPKAFELRKATGGESKTSKPALREPTVMVSEDANACAQWVSDKPVFDLNYLNEITGGDSELTIPLLDNYIETTQPLIDTLIAAIDTENSVSAGEAAHAIKGSSLMAGALRLGDICKEIQDRCADEDLGTIRGYRDCLDQEFDAFVVAWKKHRANEVS